MIELSESLITTRKGPFAGKCLVALPHLYDGIFQHSVVYVCSHSEDGAFGFIINHTIDSFSLYSLLSQLSLKPDIKCFDHHVFLGGPVKPGRGFVLHSPDYIGGSSTQISEDVVLTGTIDILKDIADGKGPEKSLITLGFAAWGAGQLDEEMLQHLWISVPASPELLYSQEIGGKWNSALKTAGIDPALFLGDAGHA